MSKIICVNFISISMRKEYYYMKACILDIHYRKLLGTSNLQNWLLFDCFEFSCVGKKLFLHAKIINNQN